MGLLCQGRWSTVCTRSASVNLRYLKVRVLANDLRCQWRPGFHIRKPPVRVPPRCHPVPVRDPAVPLRELPDGTVTFVLTDVVGSTALWEQSSVAMHAAMARHDQIIESTVDDHEGVIVRPRGEGDSRFAVFSRASAAVAAASEIVQRLEATEWETPSPIRVRVGVHTGEANLRDGDYYGTAVNLCARIRSVAKPNQVLVSEATTRLLARLPVTEAVLEEVGPVYLEGLTAPERVFAVRWRSLPSQPSRWRPRLPRRRRLVWVAVAAVAAAAVAVPLVLVNAGGGGRAAATEQVTLPVRHGYTPVFQSAACDPHTDPAKAACGWVTVPQDRSHPNGHQVKLRIVRVPALAPIPGATPTLDLANTQPATSPARTHADLIGVVMRGFAPDSPTLSCPEVIAALRTIAPLPEADPRSASVTLRAHTRCYQRLVASGVLPAMYSFATMADDVIDVMLALHLHRVDLSSWSYFSHVAFGVLHDVPRAVRTLTLDNPEPNDLISRPTLTNDPVAQLAGAFHNYSSLCAKDSRCRHIAPDLDVLYRRVHDSLSAHPRDVTVSPAWAPAGGTGINAPVKVHVDGDSVTAALLNALLFPGQYPYLAAAMSQLSLATIKTIAIGALPGTVDYEYGAINTLTCSYWLYTLNNDAPDISASQTPQFGGPAIYDLPYTRKLCASWKVPKAPDTYFASVQSNVPTLIVGGDLDPLRDRSWTDYLLSSFPNGIGAQFSTLGWSVFGQEPRCLDDIRRTFLDHPGARLDLAACAKQSPPIEFVGQG
jgi:class 3 adenylate cyclase